MFGEESGERATSAAFPKSSSVYSYTTAVKLEPNDFRRSGETSQSGGRRQQHRPAHARPPSRSLFARSNASLSRISILSLRRDATRRLPGIREGTALQKSPNSSRASLRRSALSGRTRAADRVSPSAAFGLEFVAFAVVCFGSFFSTPFLYMIDVFVENFIQIRSV